MMFAERKRTVAAVALMAASAIGAPASAETICATARKTTWNVPNGGLVISRSNGVVKTVIDAVNEWGTHSAVSHGFDFHVTHSTAKTPAAQMSCSTPVNRTMLTSAGPGAAAITLPAMYVNYFGGSDLGNRVIGTRNSGTSGFADVLGMEWYSGNNPAQDIGYFEGRPLQPTVIFFGNSNRGFRVAEYLWNWPLYGMFATSGNAAPIYRYQADDGQFIRYGFGRYIDMKNTHKGDLNGNIGATCAGLLAFGSWRSGAGGVLPHSRYTQAEKVNALNGLWTRVKQECENKLPSGMFNKDFWAYAIGCINYNVCERAGDLVANTFAVDRAEVGTAWKNVRDNTAIRPFSVSADCLAGRSAKCAATGQGSSPWGWDVSRTVTWGGSTTFACWSN